MRLVLVLTILICSTIHYTQSESAKNKILLVKENLDKVPPYNCDVKIKIDVSFINIKERLGKMTFLGPNDIDYKLKGFAFLPKKEMGGISSDLFNSDFIAVPVGNENENDIIKVIPMDINADIVTGQFWINKQNLIRKMIIITKDKGSYTAAFSYEDIPYDIPSKIEMTFDVKNQKMPALLTGDLESYSEEIQDVNEISKGKISIEYFNHSFQ